MQKLRIVIFNAQSLGNKLFDLHIVLYSLCLDVICVTESWLDASISDSQLDPECRYNVYRKDRNRHGGGVCVFVYKEFISARVISEDKYDFLELVCFDLFVNAVPIRMLVVYRPPGYDQPSEEYAYELTQYIFSTCNLSRTNFVVGDINCPKMNWSSLTCPNDKIHRPLLDCFIECALSQMVNFHTRLQNLLDVVLTDDPQCLLSVNPCPPLGQSDHDGVTFEVLLSTDDSFSLSVSVHEYFLWRTADFNGMNEFLASVNWYNIVCCNPDPAALWSAFTNVLATAVNVFVPTKLPAPRRNKQFLNGKHYPVEIRKAVNKKRCTWRKYRVDRSNIYLKSEYNRCVRECNVLMLHHEKDRELQVLESNNLGAFYRYVNRRIKNRSDIGPLYDEAGHVVTGSCEKANLLNKYFASVNIIDNGLIPPAAKVMQYKSVLDSVVFTPGIVAKAIRKLKNNLSCGPDNIPPLFYKQTIDSIAVPLALIYTQLMSVGAVPELWMTAIVVPVFKGGIATSVSNYRPISLTCVSSKIMEKIIVEQMTYHLVDNGMLSGAQHGFLKGLSTCSNLLETFNDWTLALNDRHGITVAYIDFAKAFDTVSHAKLIYRLEQYGIAGCLLQWIKNFLSTRTQVTRVDDSFSAVCALSSSVVQGSGVGPLLFVIYIDELAHILSDYHVKVKLFADDLKMYVVMHSDADAVRLQSALTCVSDWAKNWQLSVSVKKCCIFHVGNVGKDSAPVYFIENTDLPVCSSAKDLGITVNDLLTPCDHIAKICGTAFQRTNLIFRTFVSRDRSYLIRAYCTYVRPLLEYNTVVWSPSNLGDIRRVESVQRQFTKRLPGFCNLSYVTRREKLGLNTLELRRLHFDLVMCYKIVFSLIKVQFDDFFSFTPVTKTRGHPYRLFVNLARNNTRKNFFAHRTVKFWNFLPTDVVDFSSLNRFRQTITKVDFSEFLTVD